MVGLCSALIPGANCYQLVATLNFVAQLLMIVGLWIGFYFAHSGQISKHANMQTAVIVANIFFIAFIMIGSFLPLVFAGKLPRSPLSQLMMIHGTLGLIAEITGIYLVLRMRTKLIPPRFRVRNFKLVMRTLITLWTFIILLGLGIFYLGYVAP